jgi:hypothetical protein
VPLPASESDVSVATAFLKNAGLNHLRCRRRGNAVILESGPTRDAIPHVRFRKLGPRAWAADAANHRGRWERMPIHASLADGLQIVAETFPWLLAGRD